MPNWTRFQKESVLLADLRRILDRQPLVWEAFLVDDVAGPLTIYHQYRDEIFTYLAVKPFFAKGPTGIYYIDWPSESLGVEASVQEDEVGPESVLVGVYTQLGCSNLSKAISIKTLYERIPGFDRVILEVYDRSDHLTDKIRCWCKIEVHSS